MKVSSLNVGDTLPHKAFQLLLMLRPGFEHCTVFFISMCINVNDDTREHCIYCVSQNIYNAEKILLGTSFVNHGWLPRREVSKERGQQLASSLGISFREICSEDDIAGINEVCA